MEPGKGPGEGPDAGPGDALDAALRTDEPPLCSDDSPERLALRAVCADRWLARGDPRGDFLQADLALRDTRRSDPRFGPLTERLHAAAKQIDPMWMTAVGECDRIRYDLVATDMHSFRALIARGGGEILGENTFWHILRFTGFPFTIESGLRRADACALAERFADLFPEAREWIAEPGDDFDAGPDDTGAHRPMGLAVRRNTNATRLASIRWLLPQPWLWVIDQPSCNHTWRERAPHRQRQSLTGAVAIDVESDYDVLLTGAGPNRLRVMQLVRARLECGMHEVRLLTAHPPFVIAEALPRLEAIHLRKQLEELGASASLIPLDAEPHAADFAEHSDGAVTLEAGNPPVVVMRSVNDALHVLDYQIDWTGPSSTRSDHRLHHSEALDQGPITGASLAASLGEPIASAIALRRARFRVCRLCGDEYAPEYLHGDDLCQGCASRHLGIVY